MHSPLSIHPTKGRKKPNKGRASPTCELQTPIWEFQHGPSKLSLQQGCMCALFGPISSWLLQIVHQLSLSEGASSMLTNAPSCIWIPHGSHEQFLGHEVACFQLGWLCAELWRRAEVLFSSHRHLHDSIQIKIMWLTPFPICIVVFSFPSPYRITTKLNIERWSLWETTFSSRNIFQTGCSVLGLAHSLLDF